MAQVPYEEAGPSVSPEATAPDDYQHIQASPDAFGAQIEQGAQKIAQGEFDVQKFYGQVAADNGTNNTLDAATKILHGDPSKMVPGPDGNLVPDTGYYGLRGDNAMREREDTEKRLDEVIQEGREGLTPAAQYQYDTDTRRWRAQWAQGIGAHADEQQHVWTNTTLDTKITNRLSLIGNNPLDPTNITNATNDLVDAYKTKAIFNGEDPTGAELKAHQAAAHMQVVSLLANNSPAAQKVMDANRGLLASMPDYDILSSRVDQRAASALSANIASSALVVSGGNGSQASINLANNNPGNLRVPGSTTDFQKFPTREAGVAAVDSQIGRYIDRGQNTLSKIVSTYAPSSENPTAQYIKFVAQKTGLDPNAPVNKADIPKVRDAMLQFEQGSSAGSNQGGSLSQSYAARVDYAVSEAERIRPGDAEFSDRVRADTEAVLNHQISERTRFSSEARTSLTRTVASATSMIEHGFPVQSLPTDDQIDQAYPVDPETAQQVKDQVGMMRNMSDYVRILPGASPAQVANLKREVAPDPAHPETFAKRQRMSDALDAVLNARTTALKTDPAAYVMNTHSDVAASFRTATQDSSHFSQYVTKVTALQDQMGVPRQMQHILPQSSAQSIVNNLTANPENAPQTMRKFAQEFGDNWPSVWHDLTTLGKLPASYQAVGTLDNQRDASLLARALSEPKNGKNLVSLVGDKESKTISDAVHGDQSVQNLLSSMSRSGSSIDQISGVASAITTLGYAKRFYDGDADAAQNAIKSFTDKYEFMSSGGARVPKENFDTVQTNAQLTLGRITDKSIAVPGIFGQPNQPSRDDYLNTLRASPTWITSPRADALWLMDSAGRIVRDPKGKPIQVPFSAPLMGEPRQLPFNMLGN